MMKRDNSNCIDARDIPCGDWRRIIGARWDMANSGAGDMTEYSLDVRVGAARFSLRFVCRDLDRCRGMLEGDLRRAARRHGADYRDGGEYEIVGKRKI